MGSMTKAFLKGNEEWKARFSYWTIVDVLKAKMLFLFCLLRLRMPFAVDGFPLIGKFVFFISKTTSPYPYCL